MQRLFLAKKTVFFCKNGTLTQSNSVRAVLEVCMRNSAFGLLQMGINGQNDNDVTICRYLPSNEKTSNSISESYFIHSLFYGTKIVLKKLL